MEVLAFFLLCGFYVTEGFPAQQNRTTFDDPEVRGTSFAGNLSQNIALNLLKWNNDIDSNQVHSPLGIVTLLTILAEGSSNETYKEFVSALGYPQERNNIRESFRRYLSAYNTLDYGLTPYFKTWFYIYKNQTVREDFKELLKNNYLVEVKEIDRSEEYELADSLDITTQPNSKDIIEFDSIKRLKSANDDDDTSSLKTVEIKDTYGAEVLEKEASKLDRNVDDRQYVETLIIKENQKIYSTLEPSVNASEGAIKAVARSRQTEKNDELSLLENETVNDEEKIDLLRNRYVTKGDREYYSDLEKSGPKATTTSSNEPQKISLSLRKFEDIFGDSYILQALKTHVRAMAKVSRARTLFRKDDVGSALNVNSIRGKDAGSQAKMLLFNGMYYNGDWAIPFDKLNTVEEEFYLTENEHIRVAMMHAHGSYPVAVSESLNTKIISIPYQNKRFSLIIMTPNDIEGLRSLIENIQPVEFQSILSRMKEKHIQLSLPKFLIEETSRSDGMLKSIGLKNVFSKQNSSLSFMTDDRDVNVDELVQFVNVRIDESSSSENALTASNTEGRTSAASPLTSSSFNSSSVTMETIQINRPFAYFIFDHIENFIILSGKIAAPEFKEEIISPTVDVELEIS